jgi:nucleoside-diphosphate-sugar epimerase
MSSPAVKPTILFLGGAGAQNSVIAKAFAATGNYTVHVLTRSIARSELEGIPDLKLIEGDCYDEKALWKVLAGAEFVYVNTNGFAIGESKEIYWGIRMYEMARWAGVKHFVYAGLPYVTQNGGFDPKRRVPFVDGKAKVVRTY